jgi:hypothetical protein
MLLSRTDSLLAFYGAFLVIAIGGISVPALAWSLSTHGWRVTAFGSRSSPSSTACRPRCLPAPAREPPRIPGAT